MKKLSSKHLIPIVAGAVALITTLTITLSLTMCDYEEPDLSGYDDQLGGPNDQIEEVPSPYGMYDFSKRAFLTGSPFSASVYKGDVYYINQHIEFMRIPLSSLKYDLTTSQETQRPESFTICPDVTHRHNQLGTSPECPDNVNLFDGKFLIDAYESAGDFPIIYYYGSYTADFDKPDWDAGGTYEIYRYDTGEIKRKCLVSSRVPPRQMMSYDQSLFFVTQTAENEYQLNVIAKTGGDVTTVSIGEGQLTMLGVHNEQVILRDGDATIYKAGLDLQNIEEIYQVAEDLSLSAISNGYEPLFIHAGYLYFWADYAAVPYNLYYDQWIDLLSHSIRRVSLDDPQGEGELVAENVLDDSVLGIVDDVLYYSPCVAGETLEGYYYNFNGGLLKGVDLKTLQPAQVKEDCGLYCYGGWTVMSGDALMANFFVTRPGYSYPAAGENCICLYDYKTGALYRLYLT